MLRVEHGLATRKTNVLLTVLLLPLLYSDVNEMNVAPVGLHFGGVTQSQSPSLYNRNNNTFPVL